MGKKTTIWTLYKFYYCNSFCTKTSENIFTKISRLKIVLVRKICRSSVVSGVSIEIGSISKKYQSWNVWPRFARIFRVYRKLDLSVNRAKAHVNRQTRSHSHSPTRRRIKKQRTNRNGHKELYEKRDERFVSCQVHSHGPLPFCSLFFFLLSFFLSFSHETLSKVSQTLATFLQILRNFKYRETTLFEMGKGKRNERKCSELDKDSQFWWLDTNRDREADRNFWHILWAYVFTRI